MGLDVSVGQLALIRGDLDDEAFAEHRAEFETLSQALVRAGAKPHHEPETLDPALTYEDRVGGYGSLHHLRRMAAWLALKGELPAPMSYGEDAAGDAVLQALYRDHSQDLSKARPDGWLARLLGGRRAPPKFQHLICHSDCDGWYAPQDFERVAVDPAHADDARLGMIGSAPRLLAECRALAQAIGLPPGIDPDEIDEDNPAEAAGAVWRRYPIEAYVLSRLIRACEASIASGAAVVFC